jgi:hypothetical protein
MVAYFCNPSYSGQTKEDYSLRPAQAKWSKTLASATPQILHFLSSLHPFIDIWVEPISFQSPFLPKARKTRDSFRWRWDKQNMVSPYNGASFYQKKEQSGCANYSLCEPPKHSAKWRRQTPKAKYYRSPFIRNVQKSQTHRNRSRLVVARAEEKGWRCLLMGMGY